MDLEADNSEERQTGSADEPRLFAALCTCLCLPVVLAIGLGAVAVLLGLGIALGLVITAIALPCIPCCLYGGIYVFNNLEASEIDDFLQKRIKEEDDYATNWMVTWIQEFTKDAARQPVLFDYEHRGCIYNYCVRYPLSFFNYFRGYCCAKMSRDRLAFWTSVIGTILMLFLTYYGTYWMCYFMIWFFDFLGSQYEYSLPEQYFTVIDASIFLYGIGVIVLAFAYFTWTRQISRLFTRIENEELPSYTGNRKFNEYGVTFSFIEEFIQINGGREKFEGLTTSEVSERFVKQQTKASGVSYSEMMRKAGNPGVMKANAFISHAWRYRFLDVVDALRHHFGLEADEVVIWFDLFSNNQNDTEEIEFQWWCGTFQHSIKEIGRTVAVFLPWQNPIPLTRVWCLWEMFISQMTKVRFEIAMSPEEEIRFTEAIANDPDAFNRMLTNIDVEKSDAMKLSDKEQIFKVIESTVGFHKVNQNILSFIRTSLITRLESNLKNSVTINKLSILRSLCLITRDMGNYHASLGLTLNYIQESIKNNGHHHIETIEAYQMFGNVCFSLGYIEATLQCLQPLIDSTIYEMKLSRNLPIILRIQKLLGTSYAQIGEYKLAQIILEDCVNRIRKYDGFDLQLILAFIELANVYYHQLQQSDEKNDDKDNDTGDNRISDNFIIVVGNKKGLSDIIELCDEAITIMKRNQIPDTHPYFLEMNHRKAFFSRTVNDLKIILTIMEEKYGLLHPSTIECMLSMNQLMHAHDSRNNALNCLEVCKTYYTTNYNNNNNTSNSNNNTINPNNNNALSYYHPNYYRAKFYVDYYSINVPRLLILLSFFTIFCICAIVFSYDMLQHQHNAVIVKQDNILTGFFIGISMVYTLSITALLKQYYQVNKSNSEESENNENNNSQNNPNNSDHIDVIMPAGIQRFKPILNLFLYVFIIIPGFIAFHLWLVNTMNIGYWFAGLIPGYCAMCCFGPYILNYFHTTNEQWLHRFTEIINNATLQLQQTKVEMPPPFKPPPSSSSDGIDETSYEGGDGGRSSMSQLAMTCLFVKEFQLIIEEEEKKKEKEIEEERMKIEEITMNPMIASQSFDNNVDKV